MEVKKFLTDEYSKKNLLIAIIITLVLYTIYSILIRLHNSGEPGLIMGINIVGIQCVKSINPDISCDLIDYIYVFSGYFLILIPCIVGLSVKNDKNRYLIICKWTIISALMMLLLQFLEEMFIIYPFWKPIESFQHYDPILSVRSIGELFWILFFLIYYIIYSFIIGSIVWLLKISFTWVGSKRRKK